MARKNGDDDRDTGKDEKDAETDANKGRKGNGDSERKDWRDKR